MVWSSVIKGESQYLLSVSFIIFLLAVLVTDSRYLIHTFKLKIKLKGMLVLRNHSGFSQRIADVPH